MKPTETEITEALDACISLLVAIQVLITKAEGKKEDRLVEISDAIYDIYQELGRL